MDKVSLMFVENLAFSDIIIILSFNLPILAKKWVFGEALCFVVGVILNYVPLLYEILLIVTIACYRLWVLKKPPNFRENINTNFVKILILVILLLAIIPSFVFIIHDGYAFYDPYTLKCVAAWIIRTDEHYLISVVSLFLFIVIPLLIIIIANISILYIVDKQARKVGTERTVKGTTVVTISCICWCFVLSYLPGIVSHILRAFDVIIPVWFNMLRIHSLSLNVVSNPFVYTLTNARFRTFLKRFFRLRDCIKQQKVSDSTTLRRVLSSKGFQIRRR